MYIKVFIDTESTIEIYSDLSHENFVSFIEKLNELNCKIEVSDSNSFKKLFNREDLPSLNYTMWADEDTWKDVLEIIKKVKNDL